MIRTGYKVITMSMLFFMVFCQIAAAAIPAKATMLSKIRYSVTQEKVRFVIDVDAIPEYKISQKEEPHQIMIDFANTVLKDEKLALNITDPLVSGVRAETLEKTKQRIVIDLKAAAMYKVFKLQNPNRIVIDIIRGYDQKFEEVLAPGIKYTYWAKGTQDGPVTIYMVDAAPKSGYFLQPFLSNGVIAGLETVQDMAEDSKALVAVNASYFGKDGSIIGLLKLRDSIVSVSDLPRTALAILPDGSMSIGQPEYKGLVTLPDGRGVAITAVNCERTENSLVLYNSYNGLSTGSNDYGSEYVIQGGKVTAVSVKKGNTGLGSDTLVLSAHGTAEKALEGLKEGDTVKIKQTLGSPWDNAVYVVGAGPTLVKNNSVFLTTKIEEFPADIAVGRAPRTALGLTKDGHVLLVVVDGRQSHSIGMSLLELALFMQEQGAVNAMNFDGGGSSEMVIKGKVVNKPSDGRERRVGDALVLTSEKLVN